MTDNLPDSSARGEGGIAGFDRGTLSLLRLSGKDGTIELAPHGAHLTSWTPAGQRPVLFLSEKSLFAPGRPIRGGVPVIFPWFGAHKTEPDAPAHGFARTTSWIVETARVSDAGVCEAVLTLESDTRTRAQWMHDFRVTLAIGADAALRMRMTIQNTGRDEFRFEAALHTYFSVSAIGNVAIDGLENTDYLDKTDGFARKRQSSQPVRFDRETDRMYLDTAAACVIDDTGWQRRITVAKSGSLATVVWNPWIEKARAMPDFGDEEWRHMVCVETAIADRNAVTLSPGAEHVFSTEISISPM